MHLLIVSLIMNHQCMVMNHLKKSKTSSSETENKCNQYTYISHAIQIWNRQPLTNWDDRYK
jgi:hypothetical protein